MTTETLEAWLLHKRPSGDSSLRVTFFTREKGLLHCHYKGGRTPKKQALLQAFMPLWLAVDFPRDWPYVRQLEPLAQALELKGQALFAGLYVNELLFYAFRPMDAQAELFEIYEQTMQGLASVAECLEIEVLLRRFEWALLLACGQAISFEQEAYSQSPILAERVYQYIPSEGFVPAQEGISGSQLLSLAKGQLAELEQLKTAKRIMRQAIAHLLGGRELKSRSFARSTVLMEKGIAQS